LNQRGRVKDKDGDIKLFFPKENLIFSA